MECAPRFFSKLITNSECPASNLSFQRAPKFQSCKAAQGTLSLVAGEKKNQSYAVLGVNGRGSISECDTGVPFLDHMLDQIPHHGLFDLQIRTSSEQTDSARNQLAGSSFGKALRLALQDCKQVNKTGRMFLPLDEALVEAVVDLDGEARLDYSLQVPCKMVGRYETRFVEEFFRCLVQASGMSLVLKQHAGENTHHIIEAAFKAFAKALRQATESPGAQVSSSSPEAHRTSKLTRETIDRQVEIDLCLDGTGKSFLRTGDSDLNKLLEGIVRHGKIDLGVYITHACDSVHVFDDTASALGLACLEALGNRNGIRRFGYSAREDDPILVSLDLSGRPHLNFDVRNVRNYWELRYFFKCLARTSGMSLHIRQVTSSSEDLMEAVAGAFGAALRIAVSEDLRRKGTVPSSKGVLTRA